MNKPFVLTCDASNTPIGFVLGQMDNQNREYVIAYGGKSLSKAQRVWTTSEKECFAILEECRTFRTYLTHRDSIVYTDHKAITYLMNQKRPTGKLNRWAIELQSSQNGAPERV